MNLKTITKQPWGILAVSALILLLSACKDDTGSAPASSSEAGLKGIPIQELMKTPEYAEACAETPGCSQAEDGAALDMEPLWRVRIVRTASGELEIAQIESIDVVAGDGVPVGPIYGQFALLGLDSAGGVLDGQVLSFPDKLRIEAGESTDATEINLSNQKVDTVAYIKASADLTSFVIRDRGGNEKARADIPSTGAISWDQHLLQWMGIPSAVAATRPFQNLPPYCSHIIVLQGEDDRQLAAGATWESTARLAWPRPYQMASTQAALAKLTPLLCQSIGRIAFAYIPNAGSKLAAVNSFGAGDTIMVNVTSLLSEHELTTKISRRLMLQATIAHEAGHTAETLLTVESASNAEANNSGSWGLRSRNLADKTIENVRLEAGLPAEWQRIHSSFVDQGWAKDYGQFPESTEEVPQTWTAEDIAAGGFISRYASTNWAEDIADTVAQAYYGKITGDAYVANSVGHLRPDLGCMQMRAWSEKSVPSRYAALYTKLQFLKDLGLVRPQDIKECTGSHLGIPEDEPGFHIWLDGSKKRSFRNKLTAGIGTRESGVPVFDMEGYGEAGFQDKDYPAKMHLRLDLGNRFQDFERVSWPRGVYPLGLTGNNNFWLRLDGAQAGNFDSMDGFALVTEASNKRIAGSIVVQRVFRLSAPLPVPERYEPPLVVRFSMQK